MERARVSSIRTLSCVSSARATRPRSDDLGQGSMFTTPPFIVDICLPCTTILICGVQQLAPTLTRTQMVTENVTVMPRAQRLMGLADSLRGREVTTVSELAEELGVSRRTVLRDLATLRESGMPI